MKNMICNRSEELDSLIPFINCPVYIKGYCWGRTFDGWVVIYDAGGETIRGGKNLYFDYRGKSYPIVGFLPNRHTMWTSSTYDNAIYKSEY